jgi:shikimate dehydrogenase
MRLEVKELTVFDVEQARAEKLAAAVCARFGAGRAKAGTDLAGAMAAADGLVHCTPTGMKAHPGLPLDAKLLERRHWVSEIVYFPMETELLRVARQLGCRTLDGGGMAVGQAVDAFRLFSDVEPNADRMRANFLSM